MNERGAISRQECYDLLRTSELGRIAVAVDGMPFVVPISYRLTTLPGFGGDVVLLRVRRGGPLDRAGVPAALLVDDIDTRHGRAWSVLVRGGLAGDDSTDGPPGSRPWVFGHERPLCLVPQEVSGRRFIAKPGAAGLPVDTMGFAVEWSIG